MKILLLTDVSPLLTSSEGDSEPRGGGGGPAIVTSLAEEYAKKGHNVHILTTHQNGPAEIRTEVMQHYRITSLLIRYPPKLQSYLGLWNPTASKLVSAFLKEDGPFDAAHAHFIHQYLTYHSLAHLKKHTKRIIMTFHDVMSVTYGRLRTKRYLDQNDPRITALDNFLLAGRSYNPLRNLCIRSMMRNVSECVTVSDALKNVLERNGVHIGHVIHNGIDVAACRVSEDHKQKLTDRLGLQGKKVLFFGGRIRPDKGLTETFEAFRRSLPSIPDTVLLIVGAKDRARHLLQNSPHAKALRDRIIFAGWLPREDSIAALSLSSVCLTPSVCFDSFPTVNLEAMACGKPVIGTCFGGTSEIVVDGKTGCIIDPRNTEDFGKALQKLLNNDELASRMGEAGRHRVSKHFTLCAQVEQYLSVLNEE